MSKRRLQLTLFIDRDKSEMIEKIREEFNPLQYKLIKSHVTLCREDELEPIEQVIQNLEKLNHPGITIDFGQVTKFSDHKGVLIPATGENKQFHQLRKMILKGVNQYPRKHHPHITLMHPRNSTCTDNIFQQIQKMVLPGKIEFRMISVIEQEEENRWKILKEYKLEDPIIQ